VSFRLMARMVAPTLILAIGLLLLGGVAAWYLHRMQREASSFLVASVAKVRAAEELEILSYRLRARLDEFLLTGDRAPLETVAALQAEVAGWIEKAKGLANSPQEERLIAEIERGYGQFLTGYREAGRGTPPEDQRGTVLRLIQHMTKAEILRPAAEYRELNQKRMAAASQRGQQIADRMGLALLLLGMCGAVAGLLAGFSIARGIQRSIVQLAVPIRDATGKMEEIVGPVTVFSDPSFRGMETALHQLSEKLGAVVERVHESHRAAARAEQLAAVGQLAAGLAHELRNPLTSIKVLVQGAGEHGSDGLRGRDLAVVEEEIDRMNRTIQTFLDYARPSEPEKSRFRLGDTLQQTVNLLSARAGQLGISIEMQLPAANLAIEADEGQVRQVLLNLLINAMEASAQGGTVTVSMEYEPQTAPEALAPDAAPASGKADRRRPREAPEGPLGPETALPFSRSVTGWARLEVADSGCGLPRELGERIFEPFVSTKDAGTGLGLAICKRIVEGHGGRITARNRPEGGALFTVRLPMGSLESPSCLESRPQPSLS